MEDPEETMAGLTTMEATVVGTVDLTMGGMMDQMVSLTQIMKGGTVDQIMKTVDQIMETVDQIMEMMGGTVDQIMEMMDGIVVQMVDQMVDQMADQMVVLMVGKTGTMEITVDIMMDPQEEITLEILGRRQSGV